MGDSRLISISGRDTSIRCSLYPPLDCSGDFEIAMLSLTMYNCIPNIDSKNNFLIFDLAQPSETEIFSISRGEGRSKLRLPIKLASVSLKQHTVTLPEGAYELDKVISILEEEVNKILKDYGSEGSGALQIFLGTTSQKVKIQSPVPIRFDLCPGMADFLGFRPHILEAGVGYTAPKIAAVNPINAVRVLCNIADGAYYQGQRDTMIYQFTPDVDPGYLMYLKPAQLIYLPINKQFVSDIIIQLVDQSGRSINNRGEELTICLHVRNAASHRG